MKVLEAAVRHMDTLFRALSAAILVGIVTVLSLGAVLRLAGLGVVGVVEVVRYSMLVLITVAIPYAAISRAHIVVPILTDRMGNVMQRHITFLAELLTASTAALIAYVFLLATINGDTSLTARGLLDIPTQPFRVAIVAGFASWVIVSLLTAYQVVRRGDPLPRDGDHLPEFRNAD